MQVSILNEEKDVRIQDIRENILNDDVISHDIVFNDGSIAQEISYTNPFGVQVREIFGKVDQGKTVVLSFWDETEYSDIFEEIAKSFTSIKL